MDDPHQRVIRWTEEASSVLRMMSRIHDGQGQALAAVRAENDRLRQEGLEIADLIAERLGKVTDLLMRFRAPVAPPAIASDAAGPLAPDRPSAPRVLVVDDNSNFRNMITEYLAGNRGYDVLVAASGEEALTVLSDFRPQVVLLDLRMPGIGGMETLQQVKARYPALSVVMVTGDEDLAIARRALAMGAADYVTKPFDLDDLDAVLNAYMAGPNADDGGGR